MKRTHFWLLLALLAALLGACRQTVVPAAAGTLQISVTGLPSGTAPSLGVTGPGGFTQTLTQAQTLTGLTPGVYSVAANPVSGTAGSYTGIVAGSPATVTAGQTTAVSVAYAAGGGAGGSISGTVSIVGAGGAALPTAPFVPGEVIVQLKPGLRAQALTDTLGSTLEHLRDLPLEGVGLYRVAPSLGVQSGDLKAATLELIAQLSARDDVVFAGPNYLLKATAEPNDPLYTQQWNYRAINLPAAWNQTTGSADVTVAIIDSGVVTTHPDLASKLLPGYDFVSSAADGGDGDGRDGDPTDPKGISHGTHVAGIVAAATNNGIGVAGVSWGARILPVRVLGTDTGTLADAIDGILWSVGESVAGVPTNPNPADVLNLSLGGPFLCSDIPPLQSAFDKANAAGAVVVVAAGNDNDDAGNYTPASCGNVISVGATTVENKRAYYSNYGPRVDVMAPGGDLRGRRDLDGNGFPDGVLSTVRPGATSPSSITAESGYAYLEGTSMASPHGAGVAALLKSVRPTLTNAEVRDILTSTAVPLTDSSCTPGCGAGLIDAAAALATLVTPAVPDFALSLSPASVTLSTAAPTATVTVLISRSGSLTGPVAFSVSGLPGGLSASFAPSSATGDSTQLTLTAAAGLSGNYALQVQGVSGSTSKTVPLSVTVTGSTPPKPTGNISGTVVGACYFVNNTCDVTLSKVINISQSGTSAPYTISNLAAVDYVVAAYKDGNNDGDLNDAVDYVGVYLQNGQRANIVPPASGIDIKMTPPLGTQDLNKAQLEALLKLWNMRP